MSVIRSLIVKLLSIFLALTCAISFQIGANPATFSNDLQIHNNSGGVIINYEVTQDKDWGVSMLTFRLHTSGGDLDLACPISGGTYSSGPEVPYSDVEISRFLAVVLAAYSNQSPVHVYFNRAWFRPDGVWYYLADRIQQE